jgi:hypothetical protein
MEATIQNITIYHDGLIEMVVICNNCKHTNYHTITHSSTRYDDKTIIDFSKLGKRCCDNWHGNNGKTPRCDADYKLYV